MSTEGEKASEDVDDDVIMEHISLNITGLLCAIGFSKKEVTVRQFKWHMLERTDTIFRKYDGSIKGYVHSGSSSEGMTGGPYYSGELSDFDTMKLLADVKVVESEDEISNGNNCGSNRCIYVKEVPDIDFPGYVKLIMVNDQFNIANHLPKIGDKCYFPNTLVTTETAFQHKLESVYKHPNPTSRNHQLSDSDLHGPAVSFKASEPKETMSALEKLIEDPFERNTEYRPRSLECDIDMVACIQSRKWPENASNWISRPRPGNWPDEKIIEKVCKMPVYLAPVGHKNSPHIHLQWRPSFNIAEKALIRDFNLTQIHCYALLKIYLKDHLKEIVPDVLSSYCMKTTLFWISETAGKENMVPEKLLHFFVQCLKAISKWLHQRKMPHYFIETRNAFGSSLNDDDVSKAIRELDVAIQDPVNALQELKSFKFAIHASEGNPLNFPELVTRSFLNAWIEMRCGILERHHFFGTSDLFWAAVNDDSLEETIYRYKSIISDLENLEYSQPFIQCIQSSLGFLCYSKFLSDKVSTEIVREAEDLLQKGAGGDSTLCPLKLATFYLGQNKPVLAYISASKVIENAKLIRKRHVFIDAVFQSVYEQFEKISNVRDMEILTLMYDLVIKNTSSKTFEELIYSRNICLEAKNLLNCPIELMKTLAFDVTFLLPEYPALPSAVQQELKFSRENEIQGHSQGVKISPLLYAEYIRFFACKAISADQECLRILTEFHALLEDEQDFYKPRGYNLLAVCYDTLGMAHEAAVCVLSSLRLDPTWYNVSYGYFVVLIEILLGLTLVHNKN